MSNEDTNISSANINISELDDDTNKKLKGDAIGDTLYSQSFVLKTLLNFSRFEWSAKFEEDLCFLWDMTVEKDVCTYLFDLSYPSVACAALVKNEEPRFIEIVIGILANILCLHCDNQIISDNEIDIVLNELDSADPLILQQVMRFISAMAHSSSQVPLIDEAKFDKIKFIMNNSVNEDLLEKTLETVAKLTLDFKLSNALVNIELYEACLTAYHTLFNDVEYALDSKFKLAICRYTLEIICNICSYIDKFENYELILKLQRDSNKYINEVLKILHYFSLEGNLLPVSDDIIYFMSVFRYTLPTLNVNFVSDIFKLLCKILIILKNENEVSDIFDSVVEILCFLISQDSNQDFINILRTFSKNKIKIILKVVKENQHKYDYKFDIQSLRHEYFKSNF